jgi:hypothetical protein
MGTVVITDTGCETPMWDDRYNTPDYVFGEAPCQWLIMNRHRLPTTGRALAIGDGEGRNGVYLAECGLEVTSVDLSVVGLQKAEQLASKRGVSIQTVQSDLADFEITNNHFDVIVAIYTHLPAPLRQDVHSRCAKGLKEYGLFLLEAFHKEQPNFTSGGPKTENLLYSIDELKDDFVELKLLDAFDGLCYLDEGNRHQGLGHIVRLVAQKV